MKRTINSCDTPAPAASNIRAKTNYRRTKNCSLIWKQWSKRNHAKDDQRRKCYCVWRIDRSMSLFIHDSPLEAAGTSPLFSQPFLLSFIHYSFFLSFFNFCLGWWYVLSFFFLRIRVTDRDRSHESKSRSPTRQEREISNVVQISFLPSYGADFFATFLFFSSFKMGPAQLQLSLFLCNHLSANLSKFLSPSVSPSLSLSLLSGETISLSLSFLALWRDRQAESFLGPQANKAQRNCVEK